MILLSPAKVNLFLKVLRKRRDGYHEIQTLFERIRLFDELEFSPAPSGIRVESDVKSLPEGPKNLAYQAAWLLKEELGIQKGIRIRIRKRIPVSAGLGGGSSNAATVLLGLNRLWNLGLSKRRLLFLAARLGSDVPFFVLETPFALGEGRGEILRVLDHPGFAFWHCIVKPRFGLSTKAMYDSLTPSSLTPLKVNVKMLFRSLQEGDSKRLSKFLINSLEGVHHKRVAAISKIKRELLAQGALAGLMSGSGSAVFGLFRSQEAAERAARFFKTKRPQWQVFAVSTF
ncbi:MAG: 4-(cytidine 5'-diphospho)-2-C-methyl-D-erythritol kinase [Candidatus Omnitrophica bacterium]|nr:4-(cytidine 5'-diphospho)-2-C-methyl-D-erythritol kinase [Candidatus Omnitrophota bacterium]